ncbi:hypothetical protein PTKIN_Ptkin04bG0027500 [Pterospermum kingtungense]
MAQPAGGLGGMMMGSPTVDLTGGGVYVQPSQPWQTPGADDRSYANGGNSVQGNLKDMVTFHTMIMEEDQDEDYAFLVMPTFFKDQISDLSEAFPSNGSTQFKGIKC